MKTNTPQLAKFRRFVRGLRQKTSASSPVDVETIAIGLLERLWHTAATSTPAGDIGRLENDVLCEMLGWYGDADSLVTLLVECGWLDHHPTHRLVVHDWHHHCPTWVRGSLRRWGKSFANGADPRAKYPKTDHRTTRKPRSPIPQGTVL